MPVGSQIEKTSNLRKIVKKVLIYLKKTRWKFERAMEAIREENWRKLKDGESEL